MNDEFPPRKHGLFAGFLAAFSAWAAVVTGVVGFIVGLHCIADLRQAELAGGACLTAAAVAFGLVANALLRK